MTADPERMIHAMHLERDEIEQLVAALFPEEFPKFSDDQINFPGATGSDRCIGEHTCVTLVAMLCRRYNELQDQHAPR